MPATGAKYLLTLAAIDPKSAEITAFSGIGAISSPYRINRFRMAGAPSAATSECAVALYVDMVVNLGRSKTSRSGAIIRAQNAINDVLRQNGDPNHWTNDNEAILINAIKQQRAMVIDTVVVKNNTGRERQIENPHLNLLKDRGTFSMESLK